MPNSPEPDYRRVLRETDAKMKAVAGRLQHLHMTLEGQPSETTLGPDWQPLDNVPGCEARLITGAFVMEARYEQGAELPNVSVEQSIYGKVTTGRFRLHRLATEDEPTVYEAGQVFCLSPNEKHAWHAESATTNLVVFVPAT